MLKTKNKKLVIIISVVLVVVLATTTVLLVYFLTRKSTDDWLLDFQNSLIVNKDAPKQRIEKNIEITEQDIKVASFYQMFEVDLTGEKPLAHLIVEEKYYTLGTFEFDTYDEYYLYNEILYVKRINKEEVITGNYPGDIIVFWELVLENIKGTSYVFSALNFSKFEIKHADIHKLTAKVLEDKKQVFLNSGEMDLSDINNIEIGMEIYKDLKLNQFKLSYDNNDLKNLKKTIIEIKTKEPNAITFDGW